MLKCNKYFLLFSLRHGLTGYNDGIAFIVSKPETELSLGYTKLG